MKRTIIISIIIVIALLAAEAAAFYYVYHQPPTTNSNFPQQTACTLEAKLCPDGSYVGRTGPHCEFSPCPGPISVPAPIPQPTPIPGPVGKDCSGPSDTRCGPGYQCIQRCGPPVVMENSPPPGYYCETNAQAKLPRNCPICLASNSMIATPNGDVKVTKIKVGDSVWSENEAGEKIASKVVKIGHALVPSDHKVVDLVLADGREVWVSPNHPTADGRTVGQLSVGDNYDGSSVGSAELVPYWDSATYDLLPDSSTGYYWANGILLGSTLK